MSVVLFANSFDFLPGLPDGMFSYQKAQFWSALEWIMLVYFMDIWCILWPLGKVCGNRGKFVVNWGAAMAKR
jgi:hypothetical protein